MSIHDLPKCDLTEVKSQDFQTVFPIGKGPGLANRLLVSWKSEASVKKYLTLKS